MRWLQQETFMSFPSCLQRLCPEALRGARGVMGAGGARRVPLSPGGHSATVSPPLGTPHSLREAHQDTAHGHTHKPRTSAASPRLRLT